MHEKIETTPCKISPVKDGCYGRKINNEAIAKFNEQLEMICLELDGQYPWSKVECLDNTRTCNDTSYDGIHPNMNGIKKLAEQNMIQPQKFPNYCNIAGVE